MAAPMVGREIIVEGRHCPVQVARTHREERWDAFKLPAPSAVDYTV